MLRDFIEAWGVLLLVAYWGDYSWFFLIAIIAAMTAAALQFGYWLVSVIKKIFQDRRAKKQKNAKKFTTKNRPRW